MIVWLHKFTIYLYFNFQKLDEVLKCTSSYTEKRKYQNARLRLNSLDILLSSTQIRD